MTWTVNENALPLLAATVFGGGMEWKRVWKVDPESWLSIWKKRKFFVEIFRGQFEGLILLTTQLCHLPHFTSAPTFFLSGLQVPSACKSPQPAIDTDLNIIDLRVKLHLVLWLVKLHPNSRMECPSYQAAVRLNDLHSLKINLECSTNLRESFWYLPTLSF